jgi:A/G-specific adenine glycosylase
MSAFAARLLEWFDVHGRHDLPWQHPRTPYRVWVSEIMLQQTQVATVIGYFDRFVAAFPDLPALAAAPLDAVLAHWAGLGYYSRARNLHRAAQHCMREHGGELPRHIDELAGLPGIGRSTAAAIVAQAHGDRAAILDGNVRRVLSRHAGVDGYPGLPAVERQLWREAEARLPAGTLAARMPDYTQALMDLGASLCARARPLCARCPLGSDCVAQRDGRTAELPARRPARVVPEKHVAVLLARDADGRVLLERRAPAGIWGGLWSLPELSAISGEPVDAATLTADGTLTALPVVQHRFTHFLLHLHPFAAGPRFLAEPADERAAQAWVGAAALAAHGLPTPIRRMLDAPARPDPSATPAGSARARPRKRRAAV